MTNPATALEPLVTGLVAADREEARKEAILRLKGFNVVSSMEDPLTNPPAGQQAHGREPDLPRQWIFVACPAAGPGSAICHALEGAG
jgi:hypothetical protein